MGEAELKAALQREADARIQALWKEAEAGVAAHRGEVEDEISRLETEADQRRKLAIAEVREAALNVARQEADDCRLHAESQLGNRLQELALILLPEISGLREGLWEALVAELPNQTWEEIRVCAGQQVLAETAYPQARVVTDPELGGGLVVRSADGRVTIDNSLRCRLLRAWPDLLPGLLGELRELVGEHEASDPDTSC